mgnify:FL=1
MISSDPDDSQRLTSNEEIGARPSSLNALGNCLNEDAPSMRDQNSIVVKIGGSTLGSSDTTLDDIVELQNLGEKVCVVHGGGKIISEWMQKQGVMPKFEDGLRVTDAASLEIVVAVLTGVINKNIVASINAKGGRAVGLSGVDGEMVQGHVSDPKLGYVGDVDTIDSSIINSAIDSGFIPVISPVGYNSAPTDNDNFLLNINADTVAGHIAYAMKAARMVFMTDVPGVMDSSSRLISRITKRQADSLVRSNIISGGMLPKIQACLLASESGAVTQIIDGREPGALKRSLTDKANGTRIG